MSQRRDLLKAAAAAGLIVVGRSAFAAVGEVSSPAPRRLVVVFMRGAVDGLSVVVPHADGGYYRARSAIALARPGQDGGVLDLDGHFGLHPALAEPHDLHSGDWVEVSSRRGQATIRCQVVSTIRPDVVFVPYHWPGEKSINLVTIASQDPISKIPEYKVCAVRIRKASPPAYADQLEPQQ